AARLPAATGCRLRPRTGRTAASGGRSVGRVWKEATMTEQAQVEELWRAVLTGQHPDMRRGRRLNRLIPSGPRCKLCNAPFGAPGLLLMRLRGRGPSKSNPRICNFCERFAAQHPGGAEIELSLLFADVRGSTGLAERVGTAE